MRTILVTGLLGCKGEPDAPPTYHADVAPIVQGRCVGCHTAGAIGPFPLDGYDAVATVGDLVREVTTSRTMPPWGAASGHRVYQGDPSLTDAQIETIAAWVEAGMPEGDPDRAGEALPSLEVSLPRVDTSMTLPEPYQPAAGPDDYRCFLVDWPERGTRYVTGFEVHPDNGTVVHHVAAFLIRPDGIAGDPRPTFREWDESEEGPGYTCFGGPSKSGEALDVPIQQIAQWVPGNGAVLFPDGVGIEIPEGSLVVLQMHYNLDTADGNPDQSAIDLMVEDDVERLGAFAPWLDAAWTFGTMVIPPNDTVTHTAKDDPLGFFALLMGDAVDLSNGFDVHAVMLHMHTLGSSGVVRHHPQAGAPTVLLEVPEWDFDWQFTYAFEPVPFAAGDEIEVACTFTNPTSEAVGWGEGTGDEMCVANLFVSAPK